MADFDAITEETGAALAFVHHDAKGASSDRKIQDRGAGSNTVSRDYDAAIIMSPHRTEPNGVVLDFMTRNYPPRKVGTIIWNEGAFESDETLAPLKETSRNIKQRQDQNRRQLGDLSDSVLALLEKPVAYSVFVDMIMTRLGLAEKKSKAVVQYMLDDNTIAKTPRMGMPGCVYYGKPEAITAMLSAPKESTPPADETVQDSETPVGAIAEPEGSVGASDNTQQSQQ